MRRGPSGVRLKPRGTRLAHVADSLRSRDAPVRHPDAARSSSCRRRRGRSACTSAARPCTSASTSATPCRSSSSMWLKRWLELDRLRDDARQQHHRHQRQDLRRGAGRERRGSRTEATRWYLEDTGRLGLGDARLAADSPTETMPEQIVAMIAELVDRGLRLRVRRRRLLPGLALPGLRRALAAAVSTRCASRSRTRARRIHATSRSGRRTSRARTRGGSRRGARGRPGLAHRVLGDVREAARAGVLRSTAAGSTSSSRTTRTRSRSRARSATRSRASGCTTGCCGSRARRCTSRSATS